MYMTIVSAWLIWEVFHLQSVSCWEVLLALRCLLLMAVLLELTSRLDRTALDKAIAVGRHLDMVHPDL